MEDNTRWKIEREIHIGSVLRYLWKKRQNIIVGATIILIIIVGCGYYVNYKEYTDYQRQRASIEEKGVELSEEQQEQIDLLKEKETELEGWTDYNKSLLYMTFNPCKVSKIVSEYKVVGEELQIEDIADIKAMYYNYINSSNVLEEGALVNESGDVYVLTGDVVAFEDININSHFFTITVYGADDKQAKELASYVQEKMYGYKDTIIQNVKRHDIMMISQMPDQGMNESIYYKQKNQNSIQKSLEIEYDTLKESLDGMLLYYIGDNNNETISKPSISVVYVILGAFVGLAAMIILVALEYMLSAKVKEKDDIRRGVGIRCLGELEKSVRIEDVQGILELINSYRGDSTGDGSIAIVTSVRNENLLNSYIDELQTTEWSWNMVGNIKEDAQKEINLRKSKMAILIEKENVSDFNQLAANVAKCRNNEITILGYIYVK